MRYTTFAAGLCLLLLACQSADRMDPPNIILLIGDDHGYPYFGFMGADFVHTPNMDNLANQGTLFTQGYVPDNHCKPSLATLVTGMLPIQYEQKVNQLINEKKIAQADQKDFKYQSMQYFDALPKLMAKQGYVSFQGGKWWEFHYRNAGFTYGMTTGWTKEDRMPGNNWFRKYMGGEGLELARATMEPVYDFIENNKDDPFFIWYAPELPHYPFDAPDKYYNIYKDENMTESAKRYYANCTWFDDGVGELRKYLKEIGELDNTLFIYVNDNGWEQAPNQEFWEDPMRSHNGGDKGKSSIYDMSFRTPIIFNWPDRFSTKRIEDCLVHSADIPATILDIIGLNIPDEYFGKSLLPNLMGEPAVCRDQIVGNTTSHRDEKNVMGRAVEGYWVRDKDHFFRWNVTDSIMGLYDMKSDPLNDHDLLLNDIKMAEPYIKQINHYKSLYLNNNQGKP